MSDASTTHNIHINMHSLSVSLTFIQSLSLVGGQDQMRSLASTLVHRIKEPSISISRLGAAPVLAFAVSAHAVKKQPIRFVGNATQSRFDSLHMPAGTAHLDSR
jgi:hypothetical protein